MIMKSSFEIRLSKAKSNNLKRDSRAPISQIGEVRVNTFYATTKEGSVMCVEWIVN